MRRMSLRGFIMPLGAAPPCENSGVLVSEHRTIKSRVSHGATSEHRDTQPTGEAKARSLGSDLVDVCVVTTSINFNPASLLYLSR